jgi:hypothetical protein
MPLASLTWFIGNVQLYNKIIVPKKHSARGIQGLGRFNTLSAVSFGCYRKREILNAKRMPLPSLTQVQLYLSAVPEDHFVQKTV